MKLSKLLKLLLAGVLPMYAVDDGDAGGTDNSDTGDTGDTGEGDTGDKDTGDTGDKGDADDTGDTGDTDKDDTGDSKDDDSKDDDDDGKVDFAKLDLPDGMELDTAVVERFGPVINDMGLDQEQAQKLATTFAELRQADAADRIEAFTQQKEGWLKESSDDKEYGGDKFDESAKLAVQAVEKFGTPELRKFMDDYGIGNHPELIRFMVKVGKATTEDNPGGGNSNSDVVVKDRASILYPEAQK